MAGSILGSILGGKWSDRKLAQLSQLKALQGGKSEPEVRDVSHSHLLVFRLTSHHIDATEKYLHSHVVPAAIGDRVCMGLRETGAHRRGLLNALSRWVFLAVRTLYPLSTCDFGCSSRRIGGYTLAPLRISSTRMWAALLRLLLQIAHSAAWRRLSPQR